MKEIDYIVRVLRKHLKDKEKHDSDEEFVALLEKHPFIQELLDKFSDPEELLEHLNQFGLEDKGLERENRMWGKIIRQTQQHTSSKKYNFKNLWLYISAACLLLALGGVWYVQKNDPSQEKIQNDTFVNFEPGENKAFLEFDNGEKVELSTFQEGIIVDGTISYNDGTILKGLDENNSKKTQYLTLSVPKGGQYKLTLSDGTKVWLNADSKLRYPVHFEKDKREVELEGEGYFEVAKVLDKPFYVQTASERVKVLGTHFNVFSYSEDKSSKVSLIEGSVEVSANNGDLKRIKPGQESVVEDGELWIQKADVEEVLAWKNGEFVFNHESLREAMQKVARWYDIDIKVSSELAEISIWGSLSRAENFNKVLDVIKMTDENIQYKVQGRRVELMK